MGKKPHGVSSFKIEPPITFNGHEVKIGEADLFHINYGKDGKTKRSDFSVEEIEGLMKQHLDDLDLEPENEDETHFYFVFNMNIKNKSFRLIFCLDKKDLSLGVITLYRRE